MKTWTLRSLALRLAVAAGVLTTPHLALDPSSARATPSATTTATPTTQLTLQPAQVRVASLNLPGHVRGKKRFLLRHPRRTQQALQILNAQRIDVVALQELSTPSRRAIRGRPTRTLIAPRANHVKGKNVVGNGVAFRSDRWRRVSIANLRLPMAGRRLGLNMPAVLLAHRHTGARLAMLSVHNPTKSHGPAIRQETAEGVRPSDARPEHPLRDRR